MLPTLPLELLAPARTADIGIAAIRHGADAVYIGGPAFGARAAAGNTTTDIERLTREAHRFGAQVFITLNTILRDDELEAARRMAWDVYHAGADALILQDVGLLELDLPPLALHASTQMDNRSAEKLRFLQDAGFSQVVLARELTLAEIRDMANRTTCTLEFFIHGALCVSYSGQCAISHALTGRSANRGECAQLCRLPYGLADSDGQILAQDKHLLSLKDNDQSANLAALIDAGIRSFKIEGRLKDLDYVKNITAFYRQKLDAFLADHPTYRRASDGQCRFAFTPDPDKTFNRGRTDYFVNERQDDIGAFDTPKFAGEPLGHVISAHAGRIVVGTPAALANGDGLSFFGTDGALTGVRVNTATRTDKNAVILAVAADANLPQPGQAVFRNLDHAFARQLAGDSAERRVEVRIGLSHREDTWIVTLTDETGIQAEAPLPPPPEGRFPATRDGAATASRLRDQLGKLGSTIFHASAITLPTGDLPHAPAATINAARRAAVAALEAARSAAYRRPVRRLPVEPPPVYPLRELSYLGNVFNAAAQRFYERHGVALIADAYECDTAPGEVSLMITRHCLRYSFNRCPKQVRGLKATPMTLIRGKDRLTLRFDCKRCEMHVVGQRRVGGRPVIPIQPA